MCATPRRSSDASSDPLVFFEIISCDACVFACNNQPLKTDFFQSGYAEFRIASHIAGIVSHKCISKFRVNQFVCVSEADRVGVCSFRRHFRPKKQPSLPITYSRLTTLSLIARSIGLYLLPT